MSLGTATVPQIRQDNTDRNRTSPFAFTGNKFEFRMVGSSQNIALSNTVLNTAVAEAFADFADKLEAAEDFESTLTAIIAETFRAHKRILFSGNSYSEEWAREAKERGLSDFRTSPEAYSHFTDEKNIRLLSRFGVMNEVEMFSRREIFFENYRKTKNLEARTMLEMTMRDYIPAVSAYVGKLAETVDAKRRISDKIDVSAELEHIEKLNSLLTRTYLAYADLDRVEATALKKRDEDAAFYYMKSVEPKMVALRKLVDAMEILTAREYWPVPTYSDILYRV